MPGTAHDEDRPGLGRLVRAADTEGSNADGRGIVAELQEALLPTALPVLPRARIAARYLVAGQEQAAGGDWFDAIPLDGGAVALVVGDVVGHGLSASAAMGQLRAVLAELLAAEDDLGQVLRRTDAFAARMPSLRAATLVLVVLDPAAGTLRYTTCGHPPPLVIGVNGKARYLEGTGTGPLGTGSPPVLASSAGLDPSALARLAAVKTDLLKSTNALLEARRYSYQRGASSLLDLLEAQRSANEIQQEYQEALADAARALLELERVTNVGAVSF